MSAPVESTPPPERRVFRLADLKRPFLRRVMDEKKLAELRADIAANGLLEAPHVAPDGTVVSGNMRIEVLLGLQREAVGCLVYPHLTTLALQLQHATRCDTKSDVSGYDHALRIELLRKQEPGLSQKQVAALLGVSEATVSRRCQLLALPQELIDAVLDGTRLTLQHVIAVARVKAAVAKEALLRRALAEGWTAKELAARARPPKTATKTETLEHADTWFTYPRGWTFEQVDAALVRLREYLKGRVRGVDAKALPLGLVAKGVAP